jgi:two-component system response regulator HydG
MLAVSALVISSGLLISLMVTHRYSSSLLEAMTAQGENLAHAVALNAADKILINDLVALQQMLDHQLRSNPAIAYLFIFREGRILAHTFDKGVPADLLNANIVKLGDQAHFQEIISTTREHYLDIAWPIFSGKAGVLRLGFSEKPYRTQVTKLWIQMSGLTLGILLFAIAGSLTFIRRITRPLAALAKATQKVEEGETGVRVQVQGKDEVARLAASFNHMIVRNEEYTRRLEEQTMDLERAHHQTRTFCEIVQEIGSLNTLKEVCSFLIKKIRGILKCHHMVLLIFNGNQDFIFALSESGIKDLKDPEVTQPAIGFIEGLRKVTFIEDMTFKPPLVTEYFQDAARQAMIPFRYENQLFGALVVACPGKCTCNGEEIDLAGLILTQAAGVVRRAMLHEEKIRDIQSRIESTAEFVGIIGKDPKMQGIYKLIEDIAPTDTTVLIQGESGTGKELVARAIHQKSPRKDNPFVVINCSAYPATLLESELFGHEKGAFTGATRQKSGRFEQAHGGTVFMDEIGEISPSAQIKLLRVIQTQKFERIGGEKTLAVDARILAATNKDLLQEVRNGHYREDLYYRLNVIPIFLPQLRKRRNDIPLLANHFLRRFATEQGKQVRGFTSEAMRLLLDFPWPGNVRELENSIEHAIVLAKGDLIDFLDLPPALHDTSFAASEKSRGTLLENERILLQVVLEECDWNKKQAAERLGISRSTLYGKLRKYQITNATIH